MSLQLMLARTGSAKIASSVRSCLLTDVYYHKLILLSMASTLIFPPRRNFLSAVCVLALLSISCTTLDRPDRLTLRAWGMQTMAVIQRDYRLPNSDLYRERLGAGHAGPAWAAGVQLSAFNAAARLDPSTWLAPTRTFVAAL